MSKDMAGLGSIVHEAVQRVVRFVRVNKNAGELELPLVHGLKLCATIGRGDVQLAIPKSQFRLDVSRARLKQGRAKVEVQVRDVCANQAHLMAIAA